VSGDSDAFGAIFDLHRDRVFGYSLRLVRSVPDAEDVTALVFLEAWRRRTAVRVVDGSIIGWLLVTANNVVRNHTRTVRGHQIAMVKLPLAVSQQGSSSGSARAGGRPWPVAPGPARATEASAAAREVPRCERLRFT
jgi:DNA-directed RNA polymerase specialized sigma24 family protein